MLRYALLIVISILIVSCRAPAPTPAPTSAPPPTAQPVALQATATPAPPTAVPPTPTPAPYTGAIRALAIEPKDFGPGYRWFMEDKDPDEGENVAVDFPDLALAAAEQQATLWRRVYGEESQLHVFQIVAMYQTLDAAQYAFITAMTHPLPGTFTAVQEVPARYGDTCTAYTAKGPSGSAAYAAIMRYGNVVLYVRLTAKALPSVVVEQAHQVIEAKVKRAMGQ